MAKWNFLGRVKREMVNSIGCNEITGGKKLKSVQYTASEVLSTLQSKK